MNTKGSISILVIVFTAVFAVITSSLMGYVFIQKNLQDAKENRESAIQIAEAGLDYYKWFLGHFPNDLQNGTGEDGPYEVSYSDPEVGEIGKFSLDVDGNTQCNTVMSVDITSTGWTNDQPDLKRIVFGKYARPSVAEYAFLINSNVWAGSDRSVIGPYHSNGGIRMDGTSNSIVTSSVEDWLCTSSFGCSPTQTVGGVFGDGFDSNLWNYPIPQIDFSGLVQDINVLKAKAQADGLFISQIGGASGRQGYHLILKSDGTVDVYKVTNTQYAWGYKNGSWNQDYDEIRTETFEGNYTLPGGCSLIFVEDKVWIEGVVGNKVTIVSADIEHPSYSTDVILEDDITYTTSDGSVGLTVIAQNSIRIPLKSPNDLVVSGIFVAQEGYFGRNYYSSSYSPYHKRDRFEIIGTVVSNGRVGTKWTCGGSFCSGYEEREASYDARLSNDPPAFTPSVSEDYRFIQWREDQ